MQKTIFNKAKAKTKALIPNVSKYRRSKHVLITNKTFRSNAKN